MHNAHLQIAPNYRFYIWLDKFERKIVGHHSGTTIRSGGVLLVVHQREREREYETGSISFSKVIARPLLFEVNILINNFCKTKYNPPALLCATLSVLGNIKFRLFRLG